MFTRSTFGARRRRAVLAGMATTALALIALPAWADNISLNIAASGPTTITLSGGTAQTTIKYYLDNNGGSACSASTTTHVIYDLNIGAPAGVTASMSRLDFTSCNVDIPVTFTATSAGARAVTLTKNALSDERANPANAAFTLTVNSPAPSNTAPHVSVGGVTAGASYEFGSVPAASCTVTDAEDTNPSATPALSAITGTLSTYGLGSRTVTCSYTDGGGLTDSATATYSIVDNTEPTLNTPGDQSLEATSPNGAEATWTGPTGADNVALASGSPSCDVTSPHTFDLGTHTVTCSATDVAGNTKTGSFTVTVTDTTGPSVTAPADVTAEATSSAGATVSYSGATASDTYDGELTPTCAPASGSAFALGDTTVTCTAADSSHNSASATFVVHVLDRTPPTVTVPADKTVEATSPAGAHAAFTVSANDVVDGAITPTCSATSGDQFDFGTTTVTCSATDAHNNTGTKSFKITVQDTTPPVLASHVDVTVEATGPGGAVVAFTKPGATDVASTTVTVDCIPDIGSTFVVGTTTVNCTATDEHSNHSTSHFDVIVQDTTPPNVTVPGNISAEATGPGGAVVTYSGTSATDIVDGAITPTCAPASGSTFALGDTTVTCSATDAHNNTASKTFKVTVQDTTAPSLTLPGNKTAVATSSSGATVTYTATANDLVDGAITPSCSPASGSVFSLGKTAVNCSATDAAGNTGKGSFDVTVTAPWNGILQPINANGSSIFKLGSTVPVKFASLPGLTASLKVTQVDSTPDGTYVEPVNSNPADSGWVFRYDTTAGQYIYNLGTKNLTAGDWYLHIDLGDGVDHVVKISLKK
jgi:hypothetical protein